MEAIKFLKTEAFRFPLSAACGYALGKLVNANPYITAGAVVVSCFSTSLFQKIFVWKLNETYQSYNMTKNYRNNLKLASTLLIKSIVLIVTTLILQARVIKSAPAFYAFPILVSFDIVTETIAKSIYKYYKNKNDIYDLI